MDTEALQEMDSDRVEARLPDRAITSVRDIQALYGNLYTLGRGLTGAYGPYLSPDAAGELIGEDRLVVSKVILEEGTARLADEPLVVVPYTSELDSPTNDGMVTDVPHVAHAKFESARGVDHSITHISGQTNEPEKHADHAMERFTRWPAEDAVEDERAEHEDGWLLSALERLGKDEAAMDRLAETAAARTIEGQFLHTVAIQFSDDEPTTTDRFAPEADWHLPGEIEVLQEAMVRRKTTKFHTKNDADGARGCGVCFVNGDEQEVYGVVDDPLKWYLSKQRERFPRLDPDQAWRTQGLGREAAIAAQNATTFLDACAETAPGVSVFYFPYFEGVPNAADARTLYKELAQRVNNDQERSPATQLYLAREEDGWSSFEDLRFVFMVVHKYQKDRWRLLSFEPDATIQFGVRLAQAHHEMVNGPAFRSDGPLPQRDGFDLLDSGRSVDQFVDSVTRVNYFTQTCAPPDTDDDPSSDDFRFRAAANVVGGTPVDVEELLAGYVEQLTARFDPDDEYPFPTATIAMQHAQLSALANAGLLFADESTDFTATTEMTDTPTDGEEQSRTERLSNFIESHHALADGERRGVFALGALVGRISRYQRREGRSMTAVTRHPIDKVTKHSVTDVATNVVDANVVYSSEEGYSGTMYAELMDEVVDGLLHEEPDSWGLSTSDLRYHYAMGIAYGMNDRTTTDYNDE